MGADNTFGETNFNPEDLEAKGKYVVVDAINEDEGCGACYFNDKDDLCVKYHYEMGLPLCYMRDCHFELNLEWKDPE